MDPQTIDPHIAAELEKYATQAEKKECLQKKQLEIIYKEKWFKLFVPESLGGLGLSLPEALKVEQELATIDGSLGWTVTLCAGATMFVGYLPEKVSKKIFADEEVCFGGSGAITGVAKVTANGYLINGGWKYATGEPHTTIFTANCYIEKDGELIKGKDGKPIYSSFFFYRDEVTIKKDWNTMGLKATAGNSFSVTDLKAGKERMFKIDDKKAKINDSIYHYPFLQFAEVTLAANTIGMTERFLMECAIILERKKFSEKLTKAQIRLYDKKLVEANNYFLKMVDNFHLIVDQSWSELKEKNKISADKLTKVSWVSRSVVKEARDIVAAIYPYCGLSETQCGTTINRVFRDIFTASQHTLLTY